MRDRVAAAFAKRDDPYAGVDLANASRFGGVLWFLGALFTGALLPFAHPDDPGRGGWAVAAVVVVAALVIGRRMLQAGPDVDVDELLLWSYGAIASIAVLVWLDGGVGSPYGRLFILSAVYTAGVHPPRRTLTYAAFLALLVLAPLVYDDSITTRARLDVIAQMVVLVTLCFVVSFLMAAVLAQRLGLRQESDSARRQARLDPLTGLLNRRAFDEDLARAIADSRTTGEPLSVLIGDIDDFKDFNDRFGHLEGDRVLKMVAQALKAAVRKPDIAYRWGGDEFAVILARSDVEGAGHVAERVEAAVAVHSGPDRRALGLTTGVAELQPDGAAADLVAAADRALLLAKRSGVFDTSQPHG